MAAPDESQLIKPAAFTPNTEDQKRSGFRARPVQLGMAAVLLLFLLAFWFLFTAHSVLFTFEPAYSELDIDGGLQLKIGERYLLRSGDYQLSVTAPGHHPLEQEFTVDGSDNQSLHLVLKRLPGKLSFDTQPPGAQVLVDGVPLGNTPLEAQAVEAGERELRLLAERYLPYRNTIEVTGMEVAQAFAVDLEPAWANIAISSVPVGATIFVDGEERGQTPALLEILQGEHQVELQLPRFQGWQQTLSVSAGVHQNLEPITLLPANGLLNLDSRPQGANVTVDGEFEGQTPLTLSLDPDGEHRIAVFKPGYERAVRTLALEPEEQQDLTLRLKARLGDVEVRVRPAEAEIFVDGVSKGSGSKTLSLPAFEQSLEVRLPGHRSYRQRFTPRPGLAQVIPVTLLTEQEARLAELKPVITTPAGQTLKLFTPTGSFTMGASRREPGRRANEVLRPVTLTRMFYLGTREVSNAEFRKFRSEHNSGLVEGNTLNRDNQPVASVSWEDAALYCNWLSEQEGLPLFYRTKNNRVIGFDANSHGYRLPTETEWAWAARVKGASLLKYPWGDSFPPPEVLENYADTSSSYITGRIVSNYNDGHPTSAPVGSFRANHNDLYDMGGNVAEWVHDIYTLTESTEVSEKDPLGAQTGSNNVIRGASWAHGTVTELRLSFRDYGQRGRDDVGFRVARFAEEAQ
ncbi:MAG: PEGA domain-containing protein [Halieaceae bacterium]|jgi:formylglycine-generating enzyme required for sulfatase activity|nr:PEGA domain-containing protein [Halieaceae bacterium]